MPKNHAKKNNARRVQQSTGASRASAAAGTVHQHQAPDLPPVDGSRYGVERRAEMAAAAALVGAAAAGCRACQSTGIEHVLNGDRLVITDLAAAFYGRMRAARGIASPTTRKFALVAADGPAALAMVEALPDAELEDLLNDALDMWAVAGAETATLLAALEQDTYRADDDQEVEEPLTRREPVGSLTAYLIGAGVEALLDREEIEGLCRHAEASGAGGDPIVCFLCDEPIDVLTEAEVHIGLSTRPARQSGREIELLMPVWTHGRCGRSRVWTPGQLDEEVRLRGLATAPGPEQPATPTGEVEEDYTMFSLAQVRGRIYPLLVVQPGSAHPHGLAGWRADLLSEGLRPVDLTGREEIPDAPYWQLRLERGRLTSITRSGAGQWYHQPGGHPTPSEWRQAAREQKGERQALLVLVPHATFADDGSDHRGALAEAADAGLALGGMVRVRGSLS